MIIIFIIILLIISSGFFSGSETALTAVNIFKLRHKVEKKSKKAQKTFLLIQKPEEFLTTTLVGTNISNVAATSLATYFFVNLAGEFGVVLSTVIMTPLVLLFGEIIPKGIFLYNADKISLSVSPALSFLRVIFLPVSFISNFFSKIILFLMGARKGEKSYFVTRDEINLMLKEIGESGVLPSKHKGMLRKIFDFTVTPVEKIIVKNEDIFSIDYRLNKTGIKEFARKYNFTRYPVKKDSEIIGFLNIFDIFYNKGDWRKFIRSVSSYEYNVPLDEIMKKMKIRNETIAFITKESEIIGMVTLEDIMENIVGDIKNEWDRVG